jgi:phosphomannomutase
MNFDCFRAYDIRGVYPTDLDEEAYYRIAKAYTSSFIRRRWSSARRARVRPVLQKALTDGFVDAGVNVVDIGGITTDMLYFAVGSSDEYSGGIVVSLAQSKAVQRREDGEGEGAAISSDTGLFQIRDIIKEDKDKNVTSDKRRVRKKDVLNDYVSTFSALSIAMQSSHFICSATRISVMSGA